MVPDKVELSVMDGLDFSQGHHWEGQADTYAVNFHNLKTSGILLFYLKFGFSGEEKGPGIILFLMHKCSVPRSIFTC